MVRPAPPAQPADASPGLSQLHESAELPLPSHLPNRTERLPRGAQDWKLWRRAQRERLIAERLTLSAAERERVAARVATGLDEVLQLSPGTIVSFYWPFKGELDLRAWVRRLHRRGVKSALPIVTEKGQPLTFRLWDRDTRMERGVWNILVPSGTASVIPDIAIAPLVGFDPACYRLGYGGGYFDRTLAEIGERVMTVGIGFSSSRLDSILPQAHDIPMDIIVTEDLVLERGAT